MRHWKKGIKIADKLYENSAKIEKMEQPSQTLLKNSPTLTAD